MLRDSWSASPFDLSLNKLGSQIADDTGTFRGRRNWNKGVMTIN